MKALHYYLSVLLCCLAVLTQASEPTSVKIKSVRKCEATVEQADGAYIVVVKMVPIRCFDPATNKSLSVRKANNMALVALLKYLYPDQKNVSISCSGVQTIKTDFSEKVCSVECRIPQKGIKIIDSSAIAKENSKKSDKSRQTSGAKIVTSKSSLLNRQADYQETIDELADVQLRSAPQCACSSKESDAFSEKIADYEEQIDNQFSALKKAIEQERELLRLEKSELIANLEQAQQKPLQRLKALSYCAEQLETLKDFESEPEYAQFLLSNPFYREHGGVKVYRSASGCGLIALGSAVIPDKKTNNEKPALVIRKTQRIAELRAKAALAGEINGTKVETKETFTETDKITSGSSDVEILSIEDYSEIIQESATAFLERVRPVASWRSADGKEVFVVLGMFKKE